VDTIKLALKFDGLPFKRETDNASVSLLRPFRRIAQSGKPTGRINYIFFQEDDSDYYIVGSLCCSPKIHPLFFPGLTVRSIGWFQTRNKILRDDNVGGMVDHLTLLPAFERGHVTTSANKKIAYRTKLIEPDTRFWFALSVRSPTLLEPMYSEVTFSFACPPSDSRRRIEDIMKARQYAIFHLTSLPTQDKVKDFEFLHFEFFIRTGHEFSHVNCPIVLPLLEPSKEFGEGQCQVRVHPVKLEGLDGKVLVRVSKHPGKLTSDTMFTFSV
jgi:hypothetical protein